ncbi:hypothetical protein PI124_g11546 [Phytophthora idaei]|nr:hypothetical protein PI125_g18307 [Phytophthora idaei]KAG3243656.1 hypothetical protein PI124_g11546 [Phytophthora idaei]
MGNQPSVLLSEEASALPVMHGSHNARVLSLPPELGAVESSSSESQAPANAHGPSGSMDYSASTPAAPRRRVEEFYDVQTELLGRGHYATVCRGRCRRTGRAVAIKKIKRFMTDPKRLRAEITALRRVKQHPNIVELIDVFETTREVHLVLELCTGGELFERLAEKGAYSEADCVRHVRDMASAVQYLHECGIVHRDLKPENILLSTPDDHEAVVLEHLWIIRSPSSAALQASEHPLSPTIHHELAKYREHTKQKSGFGSYDDHGDDDGDGSASQRK